MKPDAPVTRMRVTICLAQSATAGRRPTAAPPPSAITPPSGPGHSTLRDGERDQRQVDDKHAGDDLRHAEAAVGRALIEMRAVRLPERLAVHRSAAAASASRRRDSRAAARAPRRDGRCPATSTSSQANSRPIGRLPTSPRKMRATGRLNGAKPIKPPHSASATTTPLHRQRAEPSDERQARW